MSPTLAPPRGVSHPVFGTGPNCDALAERFLGQDLGKVPFNFEEALESEVYSGSTHRGAWEKA